MKHPLYLRAKQGDAIAAEGLVEDCVSSAAVEEIRHCCSSSAVSLLAVHAVEAEGMNAIPRVLARELSKQIDRPIMSGIIQSNRVAHTGASGYHRLAFPPLFEGEFRGGEVYLVDDFIGQGGTLANLRGFVELNQGSVIGSTALTGRADSSELRREVKPCWNSGVNMAISWKNGGLPPSATALRDSLNQKRDTSSVVTTLTSLQKGLLRRGEMEIDQRLDENDELLPFRYSITSYGADYPVDGLVQRIRNGDITIPSFQRGYVWSHRGSLVS